MTREEFDKLIRGIKAAYTNSNFMSNPDSEGVWYRFLKNVDYPLAEAAVYKHISVCKFPPTIHQNGDSGNICNSKFHNFLLLLRLFEVAYSVIDYFDLLFHDRHTPRKVVVLPDLACQFLNLRLGDCLHFAVADKHSYECY